MLLVVGKHSQVLWITRLRVGRTIDQNVKMWIHLCEWIKNYGLVPPVVFTRKMDKICPPPNSHLSFSSITVFLCLFCHFIHNTRIHSPVPRRGKLNESRDPQWTLCCKKHCSSPPVFLELPLCCSNVYMEELGGFKTDVWSKKPASKYLCSLDGSNDTICGLFR